MKTGNSSARRVALAATLGLAFALAPWDGMVTSDFGAAVAQSSRKGSSKADERRNKKKTRKVQTLSERVFKKLMEAQELMEIEQYTEALVVLNDARKIRRLKAYDRAMIHQLTGYVYSSQENYKDAVVEFEQLVRVGAESAPEGVLASTLYNLGQMYMVLEEWRKGIESLKKWFAITTNPGPEPHMLMAQGYSQTGEFKKAIPFAEKAIALAKEQGKIPKENWYQFLMGMHFELQDYPRIAEVLQILVDLYPKKTYWLQLSGVYSELKQEKKQLGTMEVAYEQGYLDKSTEFVNMAQLFLYHEIPYKAAKVLEKGLRDKSIEPTKDNWELLANAFLNASEFKQAIPYLEKAAALAEDGELYVRLGQAHMENEDWALAVGAFNKAIKKGKLKKEGTAHLLLGMASFHADRWADAKTAFRKARKDKSVKKEAAQWLNHIRGEERLKAAQ
ncbi:MAG: tetratricopeptide repeat protein [Sphingomonadales bacterium]